MLMRNLMMRMMRRLEMRVRKKNASDIIYLYLDIFIFLDGLLWVWGRDAKRMWISVIFYLDLIYSNIQRMWINMNEIDVNDGNG